MPTVRCTPGCIPPFVLAVLHISDRSFGSINLVRRTFEVRLSLVLFLFRLLLNGQNKTEFPYGIIAARTVDPISGQ